MRTVAAPQRTSASSSSGPIPSSGAPIADSVAEECSCDLFECSSDGGEVARLRVAFETRSERIEHRAICRKPPDMNEKSALASRESAPTSPQSATQAPVKYNVRDTPPVNY